MPILKTFVGVAFESLNKIHRKQKFRGTAFVEAPPASGKKDGSK